MKANFCKEQYRKEFVRFRDSNKCTVSERTAKFVTKVVALVISGMNIKRKRTIYENVHVRCKFVRLNIQINIYMCVYIHIYVHIYVVLQMA